MHVAEAVDADCGTNAEVVYSIIDGNVMGKSNQIFFIYLFIYLFTDSFSIDSSSGEITVKNVLDKEMIEEYNLTVFAANVGALLLNSTVSLPV